MEKNIFLMLISCIFFCIQLAAQNTFPDGTPIPDWFRQNEPRNINSLGEKYVITDYDVVNDSTILQTDKIQTVIDMVYQKGGGVIVVPQGTFLSGSLFFKPGTHLYLEDGAVLKGSDDITHFQLLTTRMEGQTLMYFAALVNADNVDGFTISGEGTLNGNGQRYWKSFWLRRQMNRQCTNMEEMRPRLVYISNCNDVQISGIRLKDSPYWTSHYYKCTNVKLLNLHITSPVTPVKAPSTDAFDIDACTNVHIKGCYLSVNDDAISLKGGKGINADKDPNNGANLNIIIEDCTFGFCHSALTCGSESIYCRNIILRNCISNGAANILHLKMRPDTPQHYEYITVENISGSAVRILGIFPWTQFADNEKISKISYANNITMCNMELKCDIAFAICDSDQYKLSDFTFENIDAEEKEESVALDQIINGVIIKKVFINKEEYEKY